MTNTEIDYALALAIGYRDEDIKLTDFIEVFRPKNANELDRPYYTDWLWQTFDHQDPTVIYPLIEHYKLMVTPFDSIWLVNGKHYKSLATAIALCVIELSKDNNK